MRTVIQVVFVGAVLARGAAFGSDSRVPVACHRAIDHAFPGWKIPRPTDEEAEWSNDQNLDPAVATGDFDGDRRRDVAVLVGRGEERQIVVCIRAGRGYRLRLIANPYGSGAIFKVKAGSVLDDVETGGRYRMKRDGIGTYDVGKAGAVYIIESGLVRRIVDSD